MALRKEKKIIAQGEIAFPEKDTPDVLAYSRILGEEKLLVFCNLQKEERRIEIPQEENYQVLLENYPGQPVKEGKEIVLRPYELIVLEKQEGK